MIDSHCHLQTDQFDPDRELVISEAMRIGVQGFIVPAIDRASFDSTLEVANHHQSVWCGLGIHPHSAKEWGKEVEETIRERAANTKVVAIGEIGLDYYYDFAPRDVQIRAFEEQIGLAKQLQLPIIIHTRDSIDDTLAIVREQYNHSEHGQQFGQFHCFTGTPEQAQEVVDLGFAVSFTGNITFKNSTLAPTVQATPLESILIETDSPYLAPAPMRGKRNTPALVRVVAEKIAALKNRDLTEIMTQTTENTKRLFKLTLPSVFVVLLALIALASTSDAQPGSRPPDSVMTQQRREAEEMIRRQREQLSKEQEIRRQDSIRAAYEAQQQALRELQEQTRKDSLRAVERLQDEERARLKALTPVVWKAIGVGGGVGIGNLSELNQLNRVQLTPTSVLATSFSVGTAITRGIDFQISFNRFGVSDDLTNDHLWRQEDSSYVGKFDSIRNPPKKFPYFVPTHEEIVTKYLAFDLRFVINPHSPVKFYLGLGYNSTTIESKQDYYAVDSLGGHSGSRSVSGSFTRGGIKGIFGARYDLELGDNLILSPFADISATFLLSGTKQQPQFDFQTGGDPITFTHLNVGAMMYFGWWHVPRN